MSVIGFSSTMGTRRRMNMASSHSGESESGEGSNASAWEKMASEASYGDTIKRRIADREKNIEASKWENLSINDKRRALARELHTFAVEHQAAGIFSPYHNYDTSTFEGQKEVKKSISECAYRLRNGEGYKDIKIMQKIAGKTDSPAYKERAEKLISLVQEVDEHQGMNSKDYLAAKKQKVVDAYKK